MICPVDTAMRGLGNGVLVKHNWPARGRINAVGALLVSCLLTVSLFSGSINANTFSAWVAQDLLPQLPPHSVVVMDNAPFHKRADIQQLFGKLGIYSNICLLTHHS